MNIDNILTKFDNMLLGLNGKPSLLSKIKDIFVIEDNPNVRTNKQSNNTNLYNYSRNMNIEDICKLPCELKFYKIDEYSDIYEVCFLNKFLKSNEWWYLPCDISSSVIVDEIWSIYEKGGYGAYNLGVFTTNYDDIEDVKYQFPTMQDIYNYIMAIREEQLDYRKRRDRKKQLPNIIQ